MDARTPVDELERLNYELKSLSDRIDTLAAPSGTMRYQTVRKLQELVENIQQQLDDYIANDAYTKAQVDEKVFHPGGIQPTSVTASGAVSGASLTSAGPLTAAGFVTLPGVLAHANPNFRTLTTGDNGEIGISSSSERYKQDIEDADFSDETFLAIKARRFRYRSQVAEHGAAAVTDVGFIAEELVDAGVTEPVFYDAKGRPEGINYDRLTPHLWIIVQRLLIERADILARLDVLEGISG